MTGTRRTSGNMGTCERCGKRCYKTKTIAKRAGKALYPGERMSVYGCGDFYHLGHLPNRVRQGKESRTQVRQRRYGL